MDNDLAGLDRLFAPGDATLRGDAAGLLVGHHQISSFRAGRGGAARRYIVDVHVRPIDENHAMVVAVTQFKAGGQGQQTQLWQRIDGEWQVTVAHVHQPAPAVDSRIWRIVGDPLVVRADGSENGPLAGESVAIKDIFDVRGFPVGAGNPARLAQASPAQVNAPAVQRLLDAGASLKGIAQTDEFAYSIAGDNHHYGTPPNPRAPHRRSGGSTSGPASAVSLGQATVGLGSDTAGSVRVPASYQGLYGLRTTHGAVSVEGMMPLAPTFDTVGWLARDAETLARVGSVLLPPRQMSSQTQDQASGDTTYVVAAALIDQAESNVAAAVLGAMPSRTRIDDEWRPPLDVWSDAFRTLQAFQAWQSHGDWIQGREEHLGADVRDRFAYARTVTSEGASRAAEVVSSARTEIRENLADRVLILPTTPTVAPLGHAEIQPVRQATLRLTCLASIAGAPALSIPLRTREGLPCGLCLVASPGRDHDLLRLAQSADFSTAVVGATKGQSPAGSAR
ncbi:amidase [Amycolatopsis sp. NPDC050768]|uniref:amidase n=1 Tax=Amycolatopsis sp. NPDC050768 TaxID=3154839 RepID=UPI0033F6968A